MQATKEWSIACISSQSAGRAASPISVPAASGLRTDASDERVVDSLYKNALAGNVTAQIFWLKNRRPSEWRDVQNIEANHAHYIVADRPMSEEEWIAARADRALPIPGSTSPTVVQDETDTANQLE